MSSWIITSPATDALGNTTKSPIQHVWVGAGAGGGGGGGGTPTAASGPSALIPHRRSRETP